MRLRFLASLALIAAAQAGRAEEPPPLDGICAPPTDCALEAPRPEDEAPPPPLIAPSQPPPLQPVAPVVVSRVSKARRRVALTFDACSVKHGSQYDEQITQVLKETGTAATIFVGGKWAQEQSAHVRELAAIPNIELGNHTWSHPSMTRADSKRRRDELLKTQAEIFALTGKQPVLFRPPYGQYDEQVVADAASLGLATVEYDVASGDPDRSATKEKLTRWVLRKVKPGSIVVMHINRRGWHTAEALPDIIAGLRRQHYELVTVSELLEHGPPDKTLAEVHNFAGRPAKRVDPKCVVPAGAALPQGCPVPPAPTAAVR